MKQRECEAELNLKTKSHQQELRGQEERRPEREQLKEENEEELSWPFSEFDLFCVSFLLIPAFLCFVVYFFSGSSSVRLSEQQNRLTAQYQEEASKLHRHYQSVIETKINELRNQYEAQKLTMKQNDFSFQSGVETKLSELQSEHITKDTHTQLLRAQELTLQTKFEKEKMDLTAMIQREAEQQVRMGGSRKRRRRRMKTILMHDDDEELAQEAEGKRRVRKRTWKPNEKIEDCKGKN